jgi:hypothetical protein
MNPMRCFLFVSLMGLSGLSLGCRTYSPVERHFLRVPALAASAVATPDRGRWLKKSQRDPEFKETAQKTHWIPLTSETKPRRVSAPPGEVRFFPEAPGSRSGMIALNWQEAGAPEGGTQLWLMKTQGGRYLPVSLAKLLPDHKEIGRYTLKDGPGTITAWKSKSRSLGQGWEKAAVLKWDGKAWAVKR